MTEPEVDLASLFNTVTKTLNKNKASLNEADTYNHNHGDNMVQNFKVITKALKEMQGAPPSEQLAYASKKLSTRSTTGSAALYTEGLSRAAQQLQGQPEINSRNAMSLVQALMGGGQTQPSAPAESGDIMSGLMGALLSGGASQPQAPQPAEAQVPDLSGLMGALLGGGGSMPQTPQPSEAQAPDLSGLMGALLGGGASMPQTPQPSEAQAPDLSGLMGALLGGGATTPQTHQTAQPHQPAQTQAPDLMSGLMGSLLGGAAQQQPHTTSGSQGSGGLDLSTLLTAAAAYMRAKEQGATPIEALVQADMSGSQMNNTTHHSQSGQLVAGTLLNALGSMLGGK
jgi:hypothetical protein